MKIKYFNEIYLSNSAMKPKQFQKNPVIERKDLPLHHKTFKHLNQWRKKNY